MSTVYICSRVHFSRGTHIWSENKEGGKHRWGQVLYPVEQGNDTKLEVANI